jgi:hypothetical protein
MQELISPVQSERAVLVVSLGLALSGALWGRRRLGARGLTFALVGPLLFALWQFHKWITRFDPQSGYFGLDKVWVLVLEAVLFVALGTVLGIVIKKQFTTEGTENLSSISGDSAVSQ